MFNAHVHDVGYLIPGFHHFQAHYPISLYHGYTPPMHAPIVIGSSLYYKSTLLITNFKTPICFSIVLVLDADRDLFSFFTHWALGALIMDVRE